MKVLSLFDGISCGRLALQRAGINVSRYAASEIDSYAKTISRNNWSDIEQLGDVCKLNFEEGEFDLILAGSPCQGFSISGKGDAFKDERSKLYYEFLRIKEQVKPKYFFLENVPMLECHKRKIEKDLWQNCKEINSSLVSAQNRNRLYWTNIPFEMPENKYLTISDIIHECYLNDSLIIDCFPADIEFVIKKENPNFKFKSSHQIHSIGLGRQGERIYSIYGKSATLLYSGGGKAGPASTLIFDKKLRKIRKLNYIEVSRLQCLPDDYITHDFAKGIKAIGNGWTVDIIAHILSYLPK